MNFFVHFMSVMKTVVPDDNGLFRVLCAGYRSFAFDLFCLRLPFP